MDETVNVGETREVVHGAATVKMQQKEIRLKYSKNFTATLWYCLFQRHMSYLKKKDTQ